ncbi:MAG: ABC transporter ATP-binding protein [Spirochaetaceae bacterium]|nr:ABC transporter ATP-binding protein [Spirochaetaceae bacterium]
MAESHVIIRNLSKSFGKTKVLDDISLEIEKGSFTTLLGPSGCGKTTLLRTIAGFYEVEKGEVSIGNRVVNTVPSHLRNAVMVFQDYALFPHMNIRENITYGLRIRKTPAEEIERKLEKTVSYLDIKNLLDRTPGEISGGQQQRVALARALIMEPEVLLLDEPLSNLDAKLRVSIRAELRQIQQNLKITTIYVTHDQAEALAMSDTIAIMKNGKIMQVGSPSDVYYRPDNAFVASFVGTVNFIEGTVKTSSEEKVEVEANGSLITVREKPADRQIRAPRPGEKITLSIRPESIKMLENEPEDENSFRGTIKNYIFEGSSIRYWVNALGRELIVDVFNPPENALHAGDICFRIDSARIHLIFQES